MSPVGAEGKRVEIERPETPPRVRAKLAEGEQFFRLLDGKVELMRERMDTLAEGQRDLRDDLREHERANAKRDAETRAELRAVNGEVGAMRRDMDARLDAIERALTYRAGVESGGGAPVTPPTLAPPTHPNLPALSSPLTSTGQGRRAAVVGGGGVTLGTVLAAIASIGALPPAIQWAVGCLAVVVALAAVAVAFRWGWRAAGR